MKQQKDSNNTANLKQRYLQNLRNKVSTSGQKKKQRDSLKIPERYAKNFAKAIQSQEQNNTRDNAEPTWPEKAFANILTANGIKYIREYEILGKFYDFYLENWIGGPIGFKPMLVEIHGIWWHGRDTDVDTDSKYKVWHIQTKVNDTYKRAICRAKGMDMLTVWEDHISEKMIIDVLTQLANNNILKTDKEPEIIEI